MDQIPLMLLPPFTRWRIGPTCSLLIAYQCRARCHMPRPLVPSRNNHRRHIGRAPAHLPLRALSPWLLSLPLGRCGPSSALFVPRTMMPPSPLPRLPHSMRSYLSQAHALVVVQPSPAIKDAMLIAGLRDNHATTMAVIQWQGHCCICRHSHLWCSALCLPWWHQPHPWHVYARALSLVSNLLASWMGCWRGWRMAEDRRRSWHVGPTHQWVEEKREDPGHFGPYENIIAFGHLRMSPMLLIFRKWHNSSWRRRRRRRIIIDENNDISQKCENCNDINPNNPKKYLAFFHLEPQRCNTWFEGQNQIYTICEF